MEEIDKLITERLEERQRKLDRLKGFEKKKHNKNAPVIALLCAACLAGFIYIAWPTGEKEADEGTEIFRGGAKDADYEHMDKQKALQLLDKEISTSDSIITSLESQELDEESSYTLEEEKLKNEDLKKEKEKILKK